MSLDLTHITDFNAFSACIERAADDAVMTVPMPSTLSAVQRGWYRMSGGEKREAREKVVHFLEEAVLSHVKLGFESGEYLAKKVVQQILFNQDASNDELLTVSVARRVIASLSVDLQACGCSHRVYDQMDFQEGEETKNVIRWLFGNPQIIGSDFAVLTTKLLKAAAIQKDDALLDQAQRELEAIGQRLLTQLQSGKLSKSEYRLTEILLGQILALYPFFEPKTGTVLSLPQKIGDKWELVTFRVEQIPLTPKWLGPPILAFGLLPEEGSAEGARPRLLFPGTSQPTASWSPLDTWADFVPGYSVGEFVFNFWAKDILREWIEKRARQKVEVTGISLGGSLTLLTVSHFPQLVSQAKAFVPPAVRGQVVSDFERKFEQLDYSSRPAVSLYWQEGDFVSLIGPAWSKHWDAYRLIPGKQLDFISAHNKAFSAQPLTAVVRLDTEKDSKRILRHFFNIGYEIVCIPVFLILSIGIGIRALIYACKSEKN